MGGCLGVLIRGGLYSPLPSPDTHSVTLIHSFTYSLIPSLIPVYSFTY